MYKYRTNYVIVQVQVCTQYIKTSYLYPINPPLPIIIKSKQLIKAAKSMDASHS